MGGKVSSQFRAGQEEIWQIMRNEAGRLHQGCEFLAESRLASRKGERLYVSKRSGNHSHMSTKGHLNGKANMLRRITHFIWRPECFSPSESLISIYRGYELEDVRISVLHVPSP